MQDWYKVTVLQITKLGLSSIIQNPSCANVLAIINKFGTLSAALMIAYPNFQWDWKHRIFEPKAQYSLFASFTELFPNLDGMITLQILSERYTFGISSSNSSVQEFQ